MSVKVFFASTFIALILLSLVVWNVQPQEIARLRGKVNRATNVGGGVALGVFLVWVLAHRRRFEGTLPLT